MREVTPFLKPTHKLPSLAHLWCTCHCNPWG